MMKNNVGCFEIRDQFYLNGKPFQIISGGLHYFRVLPSYWEDRLRKLKYLGCNTVETYVPWNLCEPQKGIYDFRGERMHGLLDVRSFVEIAGKLGLWVILRPSPYICAEWDFGGLPAWLLAEDGMHLRSSDERFLKHVKEYYHVLLPYLAPLQITHGGPVIMMQVENEYGSFGNDRKYLEKIRDMMREEGIDVPLFSSDGPVDSLFRNSRIDGVFPTANFGSTAEKAFSCLKKYNGGGPCMCTEFWIGWFDAWMDECHHKTDVKEAAEELGKILEMGSVNLYMFEGGTNFGFMNGANYSTHLTPDVTSYDYDALLTEDGQITEKYEAFRHVIQNHLKKQGLMEEDFSEKTDKKVYERRNGEERKSLQSLKLAKRIDLFHALEQLSALRERINPCSMERLGQGYGYMLYSTVLTTTDYLKSIRFYQTADRAIVFVNGQKVMTVMDTEFQKEQEITPIVGENLQLDILIENMGRVNYGPMLNWQRKGIDGCVIINGRFEQHVWKQYPLPLNNLERLEGVCGYREGMPAFYQFFLTGTSDTDLFLDFSGWGKGCAFINGFPLGRFWEAGPQKRLYVPAPLLKEGRNEIWMFETEGKYEMKLDLYDSQDWG